MSIDICMSDNYLNLDNELVEKINIIASRYFYDLNNCIERKKINRSLYSEYLMAIGEGYDFISDNVHVYRSNRQSWCYGAIGISGALYTMSKMINDNSICSFALDNIRRIARLNESSYQLNSPILCHGYAGALAIFLNIYKDVDDPIIYNRIVKLTEVLLSMYIPSSKFGFQDIIYEDIENSFKTKPVDKNSFLEGTTGIILVLISLLKKDTYFQKHLLLE